MPTCSELTQALVAKSCSQPIAGTGARVILINYDDIDRSKVTVTSGNLASLPLKSTKKGFAFTGADNDANVGSFTYSKGKYFGGNYEHKISMKEFVGNADAFQFVEELKNARVVAIVENRYKGDNGAAKYKIYGLNCGMVMSADSGTTEVADGVLATIELSSSDTSKEPSRPITLFATSETATDTLVEGLLSTGTTTNP